MLRNAIMTLILKSHWAIMRPSRGGGGSWQEPYWTFHTQQLHLLRVTTLILSPLRSHESINCSTQRELCIEDIYFQTLIMPSRDEDTMKHCDVWKRLTSVMMSWWPAGGESGPRRGTSSLLGACGLLYVSWITSVPSTKRDLQTQNVSSTKRDL